MTAAEILRVGDVWEVTVDGYFIGRYRSLAEAEQAGIDASERLEVESS